MGNIPYDATEEQLKEIFAGAGQVVSFRYLKTSLKHKVKIYQQISTKLFLNIQISNR